MSSFEDPRPQNKAFRFQPIHLLLLCIFIAVGVLAWGDGQLDKRDLLYFLALIPSIVLHEVSHGGLAYLFGDHTAKNAGRLTLNPIKHIDPFGTILLPILLVFTVGTAFGYAKPVPVNTARMSRNQAMFTGLVGPATNIVIALMVSAYFHTSLGQGSGQIGEFVLMLGYANVVLAAFNLIPIPPLDGASVVERFLPDRYMAGYLQFRRYSMWILIAIVLLAPGGLTFVFGPAIDLWINTLPV